MTHLRGGEVCGLDVVGVQHERRIAGCLAEGTAHELGGGEGQRTVNCRHGVAHTTLRLATILFITETLLCVK